MPAGTAGSAACTRWARLPRLPAPPLPAPTLPPTLLLAPAFLFSPPPSLIALGTPQVYDVLNADRIVVEKAALAYLNEWFGAAEQ